MSEIEIAIDASARKHGVLDADVLHGVRHHWREFSTDDGEVSLMVGPGRNGAPLEVAVVDSIDGLVVIHAMSARAKFLKGWWTK